MWSLLPLLVILWNYGSSQVPTWDENAFLEPEKPESTKPDPPCGLAKMDLVIVLDASTSVTEPNYKKMLSFCKDFLKDADIDSGSVRVGVVIYSTDVQIQFHLNRHSTKAAVFQAIDSIPYIYGSTNTADGLKTMRMQMFSQANGDRPDVENIALVMTDGISNINSRRTIPEAERARADGIHIYAIGIGLSDTKELDAIATPPARENSFAVQDFNELAGLVVKIFSSICRATPAPVTTTSTILMSPTEPECDLAKLDLVFVMDASTSVTQVNFVKMLDFVKSFLAGADVDNGNVRVGALIYSTEVNIQFHLNEYSDKASMFKAIENIPYIYGSTNTADGLKAMHYQMFIEDKGDRPDVPNVAVVITEGISNINARRIIPEAEDARAAGIHIYAVGIGLVDDKELRGIASEPANDNTFVVLDFDELAGLEKNIFTSFCSGEPSTVCSLAKVDLVFILDASTSVTETNYKKMLAFCKDFLGDADIDSGSFRVGVVIYSTGVAIQFHLNRYSKKADLLAAIDKIPYIYGSTNTADGLKTMRTQMFTAANGDRPDVENIAIIITDGISNINARTTVPEAVRARAIGIHIYAIGIGLTDSKELDAIASEPAKENSVSIQEFDELVGLEKKIFTSICLGFGTEPPSSKPPTTASTTTTEATTLSTPEKETVPPPTIPPDPSICDENPCRNDGKCEATTNGPVCKCTEGYRGNYCEMGCVSRKDIIFVLDSSSSVGEENFELALEFVSSVVEELSGGGSDNRYALITFSNDVQLVFSLGRYSSAGIVLNAIKYTPYRPGSTNTSGGLRTALEISSPEYGDRQDVGNIVMLVVGGQSNVNTQDIIPAADDLKKTGANIMTIGVGLSNYKELESIGSGLENVYKVDTYNLLGDVKADILENSCSESKYEKVNELPIVGM